MMQQTITTCQHMFTNPHRTQVHHFVWVGLRLCKGRKSRLPTIYIQHNTQHIIQRNSYIPLSSCLSIDILSKLFRGKHYSPFWYGRCFSAWSFWLPYLHHFQFDDILLVMQWQKLYAVFQMRQHHKSFMSLVILFSVPLLIISSMKLAFFTTRAQWIDIFIKLSTTTFKSLSQSIAQWMWRSMYMSI